MRGTTNGGGGFGDPAKRDPALVLRDVSEMRETLERARDVYRVVFTGDVAAGTLTVDAIATGKLRQTADA
ncbi:hypothetical protein ACF1BQ_030165 [Bradyrhizobium sp. RDT10]